MGIGAAIVLVVAVFAVRTWQKKIRLEEVAQSYASFRACLYGSPLEEGEKPSDRLVAMELCGPTAPPNGDFPHCKTTLRRALMAWDALGVTEVDPKYGRPRKLTRIAAEWQQELAIWLVGVERPTIDELEQALTEADLPKVEPIDGGRRCTEKARFSAGDAVALGTVSGFSARTSAFRGSALRASWGGGPDKPSLACWFSQSGPAVARCGSPKLESIAQPYASSDDLEDVVLFDFRSEGEFAYRAVRALDDQTLYATKGYLPRNAWAWFDGTLVYADFKQRLMKIAPGGEPTPVAMGPAAGAKHLSVRPGFIVFTDKLGKSYVAPLDDAGVGPPAELGNFSSWEELRSCQGRSGPVLALLGVQSMEGPVVLVFHPSASGSYGTPLSSPMPFPSDGFLEAPDAYARLACSKGGAPRWAWLAGGKVETLSCPPPACVRASSESLVLREATASHADVTPFGDDRFALVYQGNHEGPLLSQLHTARVRTGTLGEIATAHDAVLLTDEAHGGLEKLWEAAYAFGSGDTAWAMVRAKDALYAFRTMDGDTFEVVRPKN